MQNLIENGTTKISTIKDPARWDTAVTDLESIAYQESGRKAPLTKNVRNSFCWYLADARDVTGGAEFIPFRLLFGNSAPNTCASPP